MKLYNLHAKVKWAAVVGVAWTALVGLLAACGIEVAPPVTSGIGTLLAGIAGFLAPSHGQPQDDYPADGGE